jgi:catechol 2,3-dioxygenase-like lactoylglutathione lyase family enzyme
LALNGRIFIELNAVTINAVLQRLVLSSPKVMEMGQFYERVFGYRVVGNAEECRCEGENRSLWVRPGTANQLLESHFVFPDEAALNAYELSLQRSSVSYRREPVENTMALVVRDPDGHSIWFRAGAVTSEPAVMDAGETPAARLQHYAVRTPTPQRLLAFYTTALGFTASDLVRDAAGDLTAAFLRTDAEHHSLAIFRAPETRFDHFSCETSDWMALRDWADHMASRSVVLAWGIGRHGPGNDTFFMVRDPDGNLAEISSDLELCADDRPLGTWEHRMETLNQWGIALMRS